MAKRKQPSAGDYAGALKGRKGSTDSAPMAYTDDERSLAERMLVVCAMCNTERHCSLFDPDPNGSDGLHTKECRVCKGLEPDPRHELM